VFTNTSFGELAASAFAIGESAANADQRVIYDDQIGAHSPTTSTQPVEQTPSSSQASALVS